MTNSQMVRGQPLAGQRAAWLLAIGYSIASFDELSRLLTISRHTPYRPENSARKQTVTKKLNELERSDARPRSKHPAQAAPR
jgi:hypothetical protein